MDSVGTLECCTCRLTHCCHSLQQSQPTFGPDSSLQQSRREQVGMDVPLAADHIGHIGVNSCIRLGKKLTPFNMAWLEDMVPWYYPDLLKQISSEVDIPILTGEDIYLKEGFKK